MKGNIKMIKARYIESMGKLLADTKYDRFAGSLYVNVSATSYLLGITQRQVRKIMQDYPKTRIGKDVRYLKADVYDAMTNLQNYM
jgi:hypothetical protein